MYNSTPLYIDFWGSHWKYSLKRFYVEVIARVLVQMEFCASKQMEEKSKAYYV